jgi:hypothetical protein
MDSEIYKNKEMIESLKRENTELRPQYEKLQRAAQYLYASCNNCGQFYVWNRSHECNEKDLKEYGKILKQVSETHHAHTSWVRD